MTCNVHVDLISAEMACRKTDHMVLLFENKLTSFLPSHLLQETQVDSYFFRYIYGFIRDCNTSINVDMFRIYNAYINVAPCGVFFLYHINVPVQHMQAI